MTTPPNLPDPTGATGSARAELLASVRRLARTNVTVIGDAMLDQYVYGDTTRISPEAPIPVLSIDREVAMPWWRRQCGAQSDGIGRRRRVRRGGGATIRRGSDLTALIGRAAECGAVADRAGRPG